MNPVFPRRSKHIKSRFHNIREKVEEKEIVIEHVDGKTQRADVLTNALGRIRFMEMRRLLGVKDLSDLDSEIRGVNDK